MNNETASTPLIGYLSFDARSCLVTLVICGRAGRPVRRVVLEPLGTIACFLRRIAYQLGLRRCSCRAIARDERDPREFPVWVHRDRSFVLCDAAGDTWMRSVADRDLIERRHARVVPNPEVIRIVRRYGYGDASRN